MKIVVSNQPDLYLQTLKKFHAQEFFELIDSNRDQLSKWLSWPSLTLKVEDSLNYIESCKRNIEENDAYNFGIFREDKLIGAIGQNNINRHNCHYELGYWLTQEHMGKGITTKVAQSFLRHFFKKNHFNIVYIAIATQNTASRKIAEKLGAQLDGVLRQREILLDGKVVDHAIYSVTQTELL